MIDRQHQGKGKTDKGEGNKDCGVKVSLGYPADNAQSKKKDVDGTDTVQNGQEEQKLGYMGLLPPKL
jgi:hypothetical protein